MTRFAGALITEIMSEPIGVHSIPKIEGHEIFSYSPLLLLLINDSSIRLCPIANHEYAKSNHALDNLTEPS